MGWITLPSPITYPHIAPAGNSLSSGNSTTLIDHANEKVAFICYAPKSGDIKSIFFRTATVTTSQNLRVEIQTTANGYPTGTIWAAGTYGDVASPATDTNYTVALGTQATVSQGDEFAVVIYYNSTVGSISINLYAQYTGSYMASSSAYATSNSSSVWSVDQSTGVGSFGFEYSDDSVVPILNMGPYLQSRTQITTAQYVYGNKYSFPFKCKVSGAVFSNLTASGVTASGMRVLVYNSAYEIVARGTIETRAASLNSSPSSFGGYFNFSKDLELAVDEVFYVVLYNVSGTNYLGKIDLYSGPVADALPAGADCIAVTGTTSEIASISTTPTALTSGTDVVAATIYNTAAVTLTANRVYVLIWYTYDASASSIKLSTITGNDGGSTWEILQNIQTTTSRNCGFAVVKAATTESSAAVTLTFSAEIDELAWGIVEVTDTNFAMAADGVDMTSGILFNSTSAPASTVSSTSVSTGASFTEDNVGQLIFAVVNSSKTITCPTTEVFKVNAGSLSLACSYKATTGTGSFSWTGSSQSAGGYLMMNGIRTGFTEDTDGYFTIAPTISALWENV